MSKPEWATGLASVGSKWLWCVWKWNRYMQSCDPDSYGYEPTKEAGLAKILEVTGASGFWSEYDWYKGMTTRQKNHVWRQARRNNTYPEGYNQPEGTILYPRAYDATSWRHCMAERKRKPNPNAGTETQATEFAYHDRSWNDVGDEWCQHRILKKTAKRIFIVEDFPDLATFRFLQRPPTAFGRLQAGA